LKFETGEEEEGEGEVYGEGEAEERIEKEID